MELAERTIGAQKLDKVRTEETIAALRRLRQHTALGGLDWRDLRDEGRCRGVQVHP